MSVRKLTTLSSLLTMMFVLLAGADEPGSPVGKSIPDFQLTDYRGKEVSLNDFADNEFIVVAFLGTECPLAKLYGPQLQKLSEEYKNQNVAFLGINANRQDTLTEIASYARRHNITFPVVKDQRNQVADLFGAVRTPEVFVLDDERKIRYWGRIDDQYGIGIAHDEPRHAWLKDAVDALLANQAPKITYEESVGCHIGRVKEPNPDSPITYSNQIARIFRDHCVECHRTGEIGPFELTNYSEVVGWAEMIREVVNEKRMPPWNANPRYGKFENDCSLSPEQIAQIDLWVRNGAPEGNPAELPEPKTFTTGWQLPRKPKDEHIFKMRDEPFRVAAEGEIKYQYFKVDPGFTEDMFVSAAEIIPGNREVVHHILVFAKPPGKRFPRGAGGGEFLVGYVPGSRFKPLPPGMAKLVPKGSELIFQVHYTPIGTEQLDLSKVGFLFAKPEEVTDIVITQQVLKRDLKIPPNTADYRETSKSPAAPTDMQLLTFMPHMHLRGKSFSYSLVKPDNSVEVLLDVPAYDFNWQHAYRLETPVSIPAGSYIECSATFDNSENNHANPNPDISVGWGDQTDDEMMIGYFDIVVDKSQIMGKDNASRISNTPRKKIQQNISRGMFNKLDVNKDNFVTEDELTNPKHKPLFRIFDLDKNGKLTAQELEAGLVKLRELQN